MQARQAWAARAISSTVAWCERAASRNASTATSSPIWLRHRKQSNTASSYGQAYRDAENRADLDAIGEHRSGETHYPRSGRQPRGLARLAVDGDPLHANAVCSQRACSAES